MQIENVRFRNDEFPIEYIEELALDTTDVPFSEEATTIRRSSSSMDSSSISSTDGVWSTFVCIWGSFKRSGDLVG